MHFIFQEEDDGAESIDPTVAMQMFSPLLNSQRFMFTEASNAYHSIRCYNNFLFVLKQVDDNINVFSGHHFFIAKCY